MIVTREFRIGNRRFTKGEHYTNSDVQKWVDAGYVKDTTKALKPTSKKEDKA